jgi:hypothetical protein
MMTLVVWTIGLGLLGLLVYLSLLGLRVWSDEETRLGRWAREMTRDPVTDQRRGRELLERRLAAPEISHEEQGPNSIG